MTSSDRGDAAVDLGDLGLDRGGHILVKRALLAAAGGSSVEVRGSDPNLGVHLETWARAQGLAFEATANGARLRQTSTSLGRLAHAERAGAPDPTQADAVVDRPPARWGLAARGAWVETGDLGFSFALDSKDVVWADRVAELYQQAVAAQWDPGTAIDWNLPFRLPDAIEDAVVQVKTYLIENETAALLVPARFLARVHPHFREVLQLLAVQTADEARHIEVFLRRATLRRKSLGLSTQGGQASLKTLIEEPDYAVAFFLLSVMGEATFLALLRFLHDNAPDPVTSRVTELAAQDEARHVAFAVSHLKRHASLDSTLLSRLAASVDQRHAALREMAGLNEEVLDALVVIAAQRLDPAAIGNGFDAVLRLLRQMDAVRRQCLESIGFTADAAERLSSLHTRNFM
jgi:hypothetical protein